MKKFKLYEVPLEFGHTKLTVLNATELRKGETAARIFEANSAADAFLANNSQEELKAILNAASRCLAESARAQSWIDSRLGVGAWRKALEYGWGACLRTPTNLYFDTPEAKGKQPPSILIPLLEPDTCKIVGFTMRRFLAVENETGGFEHPALPKVIFQNFFEKGQWVKRQLTDKDGGRWKAFGSKEYLNGFEDANAERPCFVVEGFFDWLALKLLGFNVVCLNGAAHTPLTAYVKGKSPKAVFILMGDNDSKESGHGTGAGEISDGAARRLFETDLELQNVKILSKGFLHGQPPEWRQWLNSLGIKDSADFFKAGLNEPSIRAKMLQFVGDLEREAFEAVENPFLLDAKNPKAAETKTKPVETAADEEFEAFLFDEKAPLDFINAADADDAFEEYVDRFDKIGIFETPWAALNEKLDGGLKPTELVILGGVPNVGKTALALQIADFVAQKHPVIFFTLEMPWEALYARSLARVGHSLGFDFTASKFKRKDGVPAEVKRKVKAAYQKEVGNNLQFCNPRGALRVGRIYVEAKRFIEASGKHPLIIVDYFQIMKSTTKPERALEKEKVDGVVWELKQVALALNVPILAISTLGRDSYTKPLTLSCYKESGSIEYTTDAALVINTSLNEHRPLKPADPKDKNEIEYNKQVEETGLGDVVVKVLKNRGNGGKGSVPLAFEPRAETFWSGTVEEVDWNRRKAQGLAPRGMPEWQGDSFEDYQRQKEEAEEQAKADSKRSKEELRDKQTALNKERAKDKALEIERLEARRETTAKNKAEFEAAFDKLDKAKIEAVKARTAKIEARTAKLQSEAAQIGGAKKTPKK